jgi:hypothetical protein
MKLFPFSCFHRQNILLRNKYRQITEEIAQEKVIRKVSDGKLN